jgi:hypothetical protein
MWTDAIEKRSRLPIFLLVASGYFLGVMLPVSWTWLFWLRRKITGWGVLLLFLFVFYNGQNRIRVLLTEAGMGRPVELTSADRWYEKLKQVASAVVAICVCGLLGAAAGFLVSEMGANPYVAIAIGLLVFLSIAGNVSSKEGLGFVDQS